MFSLIAFLLALSSTGLAKHSTVNITLPLGVVTGVKSTTVRDGIEYFAFKGMRYAETPERFEIAESVKPWSGIYDATEDKPVCIQYGNSASNETEDCLYLSVYTPKVNLSETSKKLSVMFWIHGGGFVSGDSRYASFGPDYLLDQKVVVVTTNYRLGLFGFLSSGDSHLPGNYAIKDLIVALQWVQNNIAYFGGDPKRVTIFGESAGAVLVSHLTESPLTQGKGYFVRAIAQSGSSLNPWGYQRHPGNMFEAVAEACKCSPKTLSNHAEVVKCLKTAERALIKTAGDSVVTKDALNLNVFNGIGFAPVIEPYSDNAAVLNGSYLALKTGAVPKVPMIIGSTSEEGYLFYYRLMKVLLVPLDSNNSMLVPEDMYATENASRQFIIPKIKEYYFNNGSIVSASYEKIVRYFSDTMFNKPMREYLYLIRNQPTYCYVFSYSPKPSEYEGISNVGHSDELSYLFKRDSNFPLTGKSLQASENIATLWANFAKYGNPTPTETNRTGGVSWPKTSQGGTDVKCMDITDKLHVIKNPFDDQYKMWKTLYEKYGHPQDTYK